MKTFREYDTYLISNVLQLAHVFENFGDVSMENYELDLAWYYTAPGPAWGALLKLTKAELELIIYPEMLLMIEEGIRGGVSMISTRYAKANNKYMKEYVKSLPSIFIPYLDTNNLYGWGMSQKLPIGGFDWALKEEISNGNWRNIKGGYFAEVDLGYGKHLHDLYNDYPLTPERKKVNNVDKPIPNLHNKTKYVLHHEVLKFHEKPGLEFTKIHRVIKFEETEWMKPYIMLNAKLRAQATNDFKKDFFKLMNNFVFGKTIENIRNRVDVQLVTSEEELRKLILKPNYQGWKKFSNNFIAVHMKKTHLIFNKPTYVGMSILDLAKLHMYDFHYNYIKPKNGDRTKLLFTDTDSLMYAIQTDDFYKDIASDVLEKFDTSNYPKNHPSGIVTDFNKKVIGMFKDEAGGQQISKFVGLRAKLYAYLIDNWE